MNYFKRISIGILTIALIVAGCNEWDDHNKPAEAALTINLIEAIQNNADLSTFAGYLSTTGYDEILASSKKFTVWAPNNDALVNLNATIKDNPEKLKQFVENHISNLEHTTSSSSTAVRIEMLNGKYLTWSNSKLDGNELITSNRLAKNGVYHVIGKAIEPKLNTWELLTASYSSMDQVKYLTSLNYQKFDESKAVLIGVNTETGLPIYESGTGISQENVFFDQVASLRSEDKLFTFIVLTDAAFATEYDKLDDYFKTNTGRQDSLTRFHLVKDLAVEGLVLPSDLPAFLLSKFNVKVPIDQTAIVESHVTSNGIIYVMNKVDFALAEKFPPIRIQGENITSFSRSSDRSQNLHRRYRTWADNTFDLHVHDGAAAGGHERVYVRYQIPRLYTTTYKVYWRAVNDWIDTLTNQANVSNTAAFSQRMVIDSRETLSINTSAVITPAIATPGKDFGYIKVRRIKPNPATQNLPTYLGDYMQSFYYTPTNIFIIAGNSADRAMNAIEVDYIELVPIF